MYVGVGVGDGGGVWDLSSLNRVYLSESLETWMTEGPPTPPTKEKKEGPITFIKHTKSYYIKGKLCSINLK